MRIAIPVANGQLCPHFGHCEQFALIDVDRKSMEVVAQMMVDPPPHEPGILPRWLGELNATIIIAGGMGQRAQALFEEQNIKVVIGASAGSPEDLAKAFLAGTLKSGQNLCDH
ncbi:MAG: ATPase [bacterium]|nr:ATPase [bacterium]